MSKLSCVTLLALTCTTTAAAEADELSDAIVALHRALAGHWSGELVEVDPATDTARTVDDAFTFAVTSEDGLNSALWSADSLEWAEYQSDGLYRIRTWTPNVERRVEIRVQVVQAPDASGNGAWTLEGTSTRRDGTQMEYRELFTIDSDVLTLEGGMRPAGSESAFEQRVTGTWSRRAR